MIKTILLFILFASFHCKASPHASSDRYDLSLSPATNELIITYLPSMKTDRLDVPEQSTMICLHHQTVYVSSRLGTITSYNLESKQLEKTMCISENVNDMVIAPNNMLLVACGTHTFGHNRGTKVGTSNKLVLVDPQTLTGESEVTLDHCPNKIVFHQKQLIILNTLNESITVLTLDGTEPKRHLYVGNWPRDIVFAYNKVFISTVLGIKILNKSCQHSLGFIHTTTPITRLKIEGRHLIAAHRCVLQRYNIHTRKLIAETPHTSAQTLDFFKDYFEYIPADQLDPKIQVTDHGFVRMAVYPLTPSSNE